MQNELVMARLRHEELEGELVRYKLLYVTQAQFRLLSLLTDASNFLRYAEAMHKSEDAMSSQRVSMMSMFSRRSSSNTGTS
jgi:ecotropic viral integration site 5 protein